MRKQTIEIKDKTRFYQAGGVFNKKSVALMEGFNKDVFKELNIRRMI